MRFSIAHLILATLVINLVVFMTFAVPFWIGFPIMTLVSLAVIPPAIIVGVVNTRGPRQAFFLGCMVAGVSHFIICIYLASAFAFDVSGFNSLEDEPIRFAHFVGILIGACGGLSGVGMYCWLKSGEPGQAPVEKQNSELRVDGGFQENHPLDVEPSESDRVVLPK